MGGKIVSVSVEMMIVMFEPLGLLGTKKSSILFCLTFCYFACSLLVCGMVVIINIFYF